MLDKNDYKKRQYKALRSLRARVEYVQRPVDEAREDGNSEVVREALEQKRQLQNRLALLIKSQEYDEAYYQKHNVDE